VYRPDVSDADFTTEFAEDFVLDAVHLFLEFLKLHSTLSHSSVDRLYFWLLTHTTRSQTTPPYELLKLHSTLSHSSVDRLYFWLLTHTTRSQTTPPYAPRSSRFGPEPPSVEDDVDVWRYAIVSCMREMTMTGHMKISRRNAITML